MRSSCKTLSESHCNPLCQAIICQDLISSVPGQARCYFSQPTKLHWYGCANSAVPMVSLFCNLGLEKNKTISVRIICLEAKKPKQIKPIGNAPQVTHTMKKPAKNTREIRTAVKSVFSVISFIYICLKEGCNPLLQYKKMLQSSS